MTETTEIETADRDRQRLDRYGERRNGHPLNSQFVKTWMDSLDRQRQQLEDRRYVSLGFWIPAKASGTGVRAIPCRPAQPRCSSSVCHNRRSRYSPLCHGVGRSCPHTYSVTTIPHCVPTVYFGVSYNNAIPADLQHEACRLIRSPV